jgi:hypothetical protein
MRAHRGHKDGVAIGVPHARPRSPQSRRWLRVCGRARPAA